MRKNGEPTQKIPPPSKRTAIPQLDAIRVVAMLGVFGHHLWKTVIPVPNTTLERALEPAFMAATGSVILFNIISGFLLALPHLGPERRPFEGYRDFLQKRFLRIIPPYYLALVLFTLANMLKFSYPLLPALGMLAEHLLFVNSLDYSNMFSNFSHFWYLGLLAQFYLLFPLILRVFVRIGPAGAALSIMILCWGGWGVLAWFIPETPQSPPGFAENLMHFNLPGRLPEFATGMWLASLWGPSPETVRRGIYAKPFSLYVAALALCFVAGAPFYSAMELPLLHIFYVAFSVLLFLFLFLWTPAARAGRSALIGNFSQQTYMMYIVHHPLFSYCGVTPATVTHSVSNFVLLTAILLPLTYLVAVVLNLLAAWIVKRFS
ncbi:MAG: acyltransferase [Syntrophobacteraceae bacterium]